MKKIFELVEASSFDNVILVCNNNEYLSLDLTYEQKEWVLATDMSGDYEIDYQLYDSQQYDTNGYAISIRKI